MPFVGLLIACRAIFSTIATSNEYDNNNKVMSRYQFLLWVALLLFPLWGHAQESFEGQDFDSCVTQLNAQCPIDCGDNWFINGVTAEGDTVWVELEAPGVLEIFLAKLTEDSPGVKRLWKSQMQSFGERWGQFVDSLVENGRLMVLRITPQDSDSTADVLFNPEDLRRESPAPKAADPNQ